jgi:biopolymer transport protein ExbD
MAVTLGPTPVGRKALDADLNLVPFIDLLVCCICFLLLTAAWTQLAQIRGFQRPERVPGAGAVPPPIATRLVLLVGDDGYTLSAGPERLVIPRHGAAYDLERLGRQLRAIRAGRSESPELTVAVEDGVPYRQLIVAMDVALQESFGEIRVSDSGMLL